jgi:hypothetical protein
MARARNLKPGFFKNEDLAECCFEARLCFAGLWTLADREGRLEDRPKRIKGELFAFDSLDVEPLLAELARHRFILRYTAADGRSLIQVLKFLDHQNPHHREPPSDLPPPQSPGLPPHGNPPEPEAGGGSNGTQALGEPKASPGLDPPRSDLASGSSPPVEGGVSRAVTGAMNPEHPSRNTESGTLIPDPSAYGLVAGALRKAGIEAAPGHQGFRALIDAGVTLEEFMAYAPKAKTMDRPFAYLLKTVQGERERATVTAQGLHRGPMPKAQDRNSRQLQTAGLMTGGSRQPAPAQETVDVASRVIPS